MLKQDASKVYDEGGHSFVSRPRIKKMCENERISVVALRAVIVDPFTSEADLETVL